MRKASYATLVSAVVLLVVAQCAWSDVIFNTLSLPIISYSPVDQNAADTWTQGFDTAAGTYSLSNVIVGLDTGVSGTGFTAGLYDSSGTDFNNMGQGAPGTLLTPLVPVDPSGADPYVFGNYEYQPLTPVTLDPNSAYYVVLSVVPGDGSGQYGWDWAGASAPSIGFGLWGSYDGGSVWSMNGPAEPYLMQVNASPLGTVPEPGTLALLLLGLPMAGLLKRRRK